MICTNKQIKIVEDNVLRSFKCWYMLLFSLYSYLIGVVHVNLWLNNNSVIRFLLHFFFTQSLLQKKKKKGPIIIETTCLNKGLTNCHWGQSAPILLWATGLVMCPGPITEAAQHISIPNVVCFSIIFHSSPAEDRVSATLSRMLT